MSETDITPRPSNMGLRMAEFSDDETLRSGHIVHALLSVVGDFAQITG